MKTKLKSENFTKFRRSTPWGYMPVDVEEKIDEYEKIINNLNDKIIELRQGTNSYKEKIERLESTCANLKHQLMSVEVQDMSSVMQDRILNEFKEGRNQSKTRDIEIPEDVPIVFDILKM